MESQLLTYVKKRMTIGDGLFLSSLVLASVALYIATKDRWAWKKILVRSTVAGGALITIIAGGIYGWTVWDTRLQPQRSLWGIELGMPDAEVRFLRGQPDAVGRHGSWTYRESDSSGPSYAYVVEFKDGKVIGVFYVGGDRISPTLQGVSASDTNSTFKSGSGQRRKLNCRRMD